ncbi:MAG: Fic family protein [Candidatus Moranbacteria bacterium]|nr:Fic family protein [Candidatus Moranbacteria bacterium]
MSELKEIKPSKVKELPPKIAYEPIMKELTAAHLAVGELKGFLNTLHNPDLLIAPFRKREAVASSAIEGTRATLEEVLKYEAVAEPRTISEKDKQNVKTQDIIEVKNYEEAMKEALKLLKDKSIAENLLKSTHFILLKSVRGTNRNRGNFRREQVIVGDYVPPVFTDIPKLMSNWEKYLNSDIENDILVRIGIAHYQFEAIHPFLDGNGRIGRLIIPLFLCQVGMLPAPVLFISHHLEEHKVEYQRLLHKVDTDQDWTLWLKFFLTAVEVQARTTIKMAKEIQELYERSKNKIIENIRSRHSITVLDVIFARPIITANNIREELKAKSKGTTYNLLEKFVKEGILKEYRIGRESIYLFSDLLKILRV